MTRALKDLPPEELKIKSTKPKPSAQWAVLVSLVAHQTIEALTGIYVGALVEGEVEPSLIAIVTLIFEGSAYILGVLVTIWP